MSAGGIRSETAAAVVTLQCAVRQKYGSILSYPILFYSDDFIYSTLKFTVIFIDGIRSSDWSHVSSNDSLPSRPPLSSKHGAVWGFSDSFDGAFDGRIGKSLIKSLVKSYTIYK